MKKITLLISIQFLFLIVALQVNCFAENLENMPTALDTKYFSNLIDEDSNQTSFYLFLQTEITLQIELTGESWGNTTGTILAGLNIQLIEDSTSEIVKEWLVLHQDNTKHFFSSETPMQGVLKIKFALMKVSSVVINWRITENIPIWTYNAQFGISTNQIFFSLERTENVNSYTNKMRLMLSSPFSSQIEYNVNVTTNRNTSIMQYSSKISKDRNHLVSVVTATEFSSFEWYSIIINSKSPIENYLFLKIYYDHVHWKNVARIFLNKPSENINQIALDSSHSSGKFLWTKAHMPSNNTTQIVVLRLIATWVIVIISVIGVIVTVSILLLLFFARKVYLAKKTHKQKLNQNESMNNKMCYDSLPSEKYDTTNHAVYEPQTTFSVNFKNIPNNYSIESSVGTNVKCNICLQHIKDDDLIIRCPSCDVAFHKDHLYQWIIEQMSCPVCKVQLRITEASL